MKHENISSYDARNQQQQKVDYSQAANGQVSESGLVLTTECEDVEEEKDTVAWDPNAYLREDSVSKVSVSVQLALLTHLMWSRSTE